MPRTRSARASGAALRTALEHRRLIGFDRRLLADQTVTRCFGNYHTTIIRISFTVYQDVERPFGEVVIFQLFFDIVDLTIGDNDCTGIAILSDVCSGRHQCLAKQRAIFVLSRRANTTKLHNPGFQRTIIFRSCLKPGQHLITLFCALPNTLTWRLVDHNQCHIRLRLSSPVS